jgi:Polysaccharide lyase
VTTPRSFSDATVQKGAWWQPLRDDFEGPGFSPAGGLYYRDNFEQSAGTIEFQRAVRLTGAGGLKLSVRPIAAAGSDHSERAEVWERTDLWAPYGEGMWYGFAVRFADPIPGDDHRYLIAQWKREILPGAEGDFSPFLALRMTNGKLYATVEANYVAPSAGAGGIPTFFRPQKNQMRALVATDDSWTAADAKLFSSSTAALDVEQHGNPLPRPSSGWIELAVFVKPGPDGSGHIEIIANGKPVATIKGPIGHADKGLGGRQYFKFGPYRAGHAGTWTLYYDHFRRSPDRRDVVE